MSVIAIFSRPYCSAEEIAAGVAERLGYEAISREVVQEAARSSGVPEHKMERAVTGSRALFDSFTHEWEKNLVRIRASLAATLEDEQVFFGPAAYLIPQPITHVLRVELVADRDNRISNAMEAENLSAADAEALIAKSDQEFVAWTEGILTRVSWDPFFYDMRVALTSTSIEEAVDHICEAVGRDTFKPSEASMEVVRDWRRAAELSLALLDKGQYDCEVTAEGGKVTITVLQGPTPKGKLARTVQSLRYENVESEVQELCVDLDWVEELVVRPGTAFTQGDEVELPAESLEPLPSPERAPALEEKSERKVKVLLVDDDVELVEHLGKRLRARNYAVEIVNRGEEAVELVGERTFDVAVVDLNMPGIDGIETLRQLKRVQPMLQVIILTGCGTLENAFETGQLGSVRFLQKPHEFKELLEDIDGAAEHKKRAEQSAYEREYNAIITQLRSKQDVVAAIERLKEKYSQ